MARQADERKFLAWRGRLARHAKAGLTVARFCEREDVAVATFEHVPDAHLAALALEHGLAAVSADADYSRFPNVRLENPVAG